MSWVLPHVNKVAIKYEELEFNWGSYCFFGVGDFSIRDVIDVRGLHHVNKVATKYEEIEFQLGILLYFGSRRCFN